MCENVLKFHLFRDYQNCSNLIISDSILSVNYLIPFLFLKIMSRSNKKTSVLI